MRFAPFALVLCALLWGCAGGAPDYQVRIDATDKVAHGYGHGILIDSRHVATVEHVAPRRDLDYRVSRADLHRGSHRRIRYIKAKLVGFYGTKRRTVERLSVLRLSKPMWCAEFPKFRNVEAGDSGSPILGKRGEVVGLVTGFKPQMFFMGRFIPGPSIVGSNGPVGPVLPFVKTRPKKRPKRTKQEVK